MPTFHSFHSPLTRRGFVLASAGGLATVLRPGPLRSMQTASLPRAAGPRWRPTSDLLRTLPRLLELAAVPGVAVATVDDGRIFVGNAGRAQVAPRQAVDDATVFEAASLGKPLFACGVLQLVDAGQLALDRPLRDYLRAPDADGTRMRRVTARHVLSHTTGLPNWRREPGPLEPAAEPGSVFSYSGEGFFHLQRVVEAVTGQPVARFMRERVLDPLGMAESSYVWRPAYDARMAVGYDERGQRVEVYAAMGRRAAVIAREWGKPLEEWRYEDAARTVTLINPAWPVLPLYMVPNVAASLLTTAGDYARFLDRLVALPARPGLDLAPGTRDAMTTQQVQLNSALAWGLGWGLQHDEFGQTLWHWGANNCFRNFAMADPANGRALVVLTNGENGPRVYERVIASLTGRDHPAFLWG